jgi:hypothetical protein
VNRQEALYFRGVGFCAEEYVGKPLIIVVDHASIGVELHGSVAFLSEETRTLWGLPRPAADSHPVVIPATRARDAYNRLDASIRVQ